MKALGRLLEIIRDLVRGTPEPAQEAQERAEQRCRLARAAAALAVAQAQRTELELREALGRGKEGELLLPALVERLEEDRRRARLQVETFRELQRQAAAQMRLQGDVQGLEALNRERENLQSVLARANAAGNRAELEQLEVEVRAEAARLDLLEQLERGFEPSHTFRSLPIFPHEIRARAEKLVQSEGLRTEAADQEAD